MGKEEKVFADKLKRQSRVQESRAKGRSIGQTFIQVPRDIAEALRMNKGDVVEFEVDWKKRDYSIKLRKRIPWKIINQKS